jgi:hypothetical protein
MRVTLLFTTLFPAQFLINEARYIETPVALTATVGEQAHQLHDAILNAAPARPAHLNGLATGTHAA